MAVTVDPGGNVLVVAPARLDTVRIDAIVTRKAAWIVQRLRRAESQGPSPRAARVRQRREHLRHRGHGRDYWQAVGRVMPDYERRREELRQCGVMLAW